MTLTDGKCPLCNTPVVTVVNGIQLWFKPHDDPEWCREAALMHVRMLERAIKDRSEEAALAKYRESFYRCAYATALVYLERETERDHEHWREDVEREVRGDAERARMESAVMHALVSDMKVTP